MDIQVMGLPPEEDSPASASSSSSSSAQSTPPPPPPASQPTDSKSKKPRSCAPCRLRRVACTRGQDPEAPCLKCVKKRIACTPVSDESRKCLNRNGRRIDLVRQIFGDADNGPNSGALATLKSSTERSTGKGTEASKGKARGMKEERQLDVSPSSVENQLSTSTLSSAFAADLLDYSLAHVEAFPSPVEGAEIRSSFEKAGRQLQQMDPQDQVMCWVLIATAARTSSHPLLVGPSAPTGADFRTQIQLGNSLSKYGIQRESICSALREIAVRNMDERGTLRIASVKNLTTCMVAASLSADSELQALPNAYDAASINHSKSLLASGAFNFNRNFSRTTRGAGPRRLAFNVYMRDCLTSAHRGRPSQFCEEDVALLFLGLQTWPLETVLDILGNPLNSNVPLLSIVALLSIAHELTGTAAMIQKDLTGFKARNTPTFNSATISTCIKRVRLTLRGIELVLKVQREAPHRLSSGPFEEGGIDAAWRTGSVAACCQAFLLHETVARHLGLEPPFLVVGTFHRLYDEELVEVEEIGKEMEVLPPRVAQLSFEAARRLVLMFQQAIDDGAEMSLLDWIGVRACRLALEYLPTWQGILFNTPTSEEGGPKDWTFDTKLQSLGTIVCVFRCLSWGWPVYGQKSEEVQGLVDRVQKARDEYKLKSGAMAFAGLSSTLTLPPPMAPFPAPDPDIMSPLSAEDIQSIMNFDLSLVLSTVVS
ncbi:hypothetical protein T439DRAFT_321528 [Meredithblackwellia eburnea MCA 4105]